MNALMFSRLSLTLILSLGVVIPATSQKAATDTPGSKASDLPTWKATPVGLSPLAPKALDVARGEIQIRGGGYGIGPITGGDELAYWSEAITGDFCVTLRVRGLSGPGKPTVGLMLRESVSPESRFSFLGALLEDNGNLRPVAIGRQGFITAPMDVPSRGFSYEQEAWLRFTRCGDEISLHHSPDGQTWRNHSWQWSHTLRGLPETVQLGVAITARSVGKQAQATVELMELRTLFKPEVTTSWFGNTYPGFTYIPMQMRDIAIEPKLGLLAIQAMHDEVKRDGALWDLAGNLVADLFETRQHHGGVAIAIDEQWVYYGRGGDDRGVMRYTHDGKPDRKNIALTGHMVLDLVAEGKSVWAITDDGFLHKLTRELKTQRSFEMSGARHMAVDASGNLYVLRREKAAKSDEIWRLPAGGDSFERVTELPAEIDGRGLAFDPLTGNLYLCDMGPAQQLDILSPQGQIVGHFGAEGGVYGDYADTLRGQTHPLKLPGPVSVAFDAEGMLYIACDGPELEIAGSLDLRKFNREGEMLWRRIGLEFVDSGDADPVDQSVFTREHRYQMNPAIGSQELAHAATTLDPFRYPDDPRLHLHFKQLTSVRLRRLDEHRVMFADAMRGKTVTVYRFEPNSEIAVPCGLFHAGGELGLTSPWPASAPTGEGGWVWIDANADGRFDKNEFTAADFGGISYVDEKGGIWFVDGNTTKNIAGDVYYFPCLGVSDGVPRYDINAMRRFESPAGLSMVTRFMYDAGRDAAFVAGYDRNTKWDRETFHWADAGDILARIDDVLQGEPHTAWSVKLPNAGRPPGDRHASYNFVQFDQAGEYVFGCISAETLIYAFSKEDGRLVDEFRPGPEVGGYTGLVDITNGIKASVDSDGTYLIVTEEDARAKGIVMEWTPSPGSSKP